MPYPPFPVFPPPLPGVAFQGQAGGFLGFQVPAFQWYVNPSADYGYATVVPVAQAGGAQPALPAFYSGGAVRVTVNIFDTAGNPFVPYAFRWRLDDAPSAENVLWWSTVPYPGSTVYLLIPPYANAFISQSLTSETRSVLCEIADWEGLVFVARGQYTLINELGGVIVRSFGFETGAFQTGTFQTGDVAGT